MTRDLAFTADTSRGEALRRLTAAFGEASIDTPALDARVLIAAALDVEPSELVLRPDHALGRRVARVTASARRRLAGEPVARILGRREFWSLDFSLSAATLVPRPETEAIVSTVLARCRGAIDAPLEILDLGTGSGCILVALLTELPAAHGLGVDRHLEALRTARGNAGLNGVGGRAVFAASNWTAAVRGPFDVIVANPPYVRTSDILTLAREVRGHDPVAALDGGRDGLDAYRAIVPGLTGLLAANGLVALELGAGQADAVERLVRDAGLAKTEMGHDLTGTARVILATR